MEGGAAVRRANSVIKLIAGIIAGLSSLWTLLSGAWDMFPGLPDWVDMVLLLVFVLLAVFLVAGSVLDLIVSREGVRQYRFRPGSKEFYRFFTEWYKKPGKLSIICDDLDWTWSEENSSIFDQLVRKSESGELDLLLGRGLHSPIAQELVRKGARLRGAPGQLVSMYTFSCLSVMDDVAGRIIVRDKRKNPSAAGEKLIFQEISNTYVMDLLTAMLLEGEDKGCRTDHSPAKDRI